MGTRPVERCTRPLWSVNERGQRSKRRGGIRRVERGTVVGSIWYRVWAWAPSARMAVAMIAAMFLKEGISSN